MIKKCLYFYVYIWNHNIVFVTQTRYVLKIEMSIKMESESVRGTKKGSFEGFERFEALFLMLRNFRQYT